MLSPARNFAASFPVVLFIRLGCGRPLAAARRHFLFPIHGCVPFPAMQLVLPGGGRSGQRRGDAVISLIHVIAWRLPAVLFIRLAWRPAWEHAERSSHAQACGMTRLTSVGLGDAACHPPHAICGLIPCRAVYTTYRVWPAMGDASPNTTTRPPLPAMGIWGQPARAAAWRCRYISEHVFAWRPLPCCLYGLDGGLAESGLGTSPTRTYTDTPRSGTHARQLIKSCLICDCSLLP